MTDPQHPTPDPAAPQPGQITPVPTPAAAEIVDPDPTKAADYEVGLQSLNQWQLAWRKFRKHKLALLGLGILAAILLISTIGPLLLPFDFKEIPDPSQIVQMGRPPFCVEYQPKSGSTPATCLAWGLSHPMGETGGLQRDVLTLVVNGARTSLLIGFVSMAIGVLIGTIVGSIAGFAGGIVDNSLMRIVDIFLSLPTLFVILVASKFLGNGTVTVVIVIFGLFSWMGVSRLVRSLFLSIREREFVEAAQAVGVTDRRIIFRHILPNAFSPIVVAASLIVASVIISEAFVSFLGFGVDPTSPTWGNILSGGLQFLALGNWWWPFFPGLAIIITVLAVNFVGDGLRDAFDPRSRA
jgi:peptide/nickel transport system permease protein